MKRLRVLTVLAVATVLLAATTGAAFSQEAVYEVTITNLTPGQVLSPPVVVVHDPGITLFEAGAPASEPLRYLAEDGMTGPLVEGLEGDPDVSGFGVAGGPVPPGQSIAVEVTAGSGPLVVSALGMLVTTNDGFFAVNSLPAPNHRLRGVQTAGLLGRAYAHAWDAGTEANSESCEQIPGPPCGNPGVRNTDGAEGFVHIHAGIAGVADLSPEDLDWNNPVALVEVTRIR